jgi:hypothetical protein
MARTQPFPRAWQAAARARALASRISRLLGRPARHGRDALTLVLRESTASSVLVKRTPLAIRCAQGSVWVTHAGDLEDHVLEVGQQFVASGRGRLAVFALEPSRVVLVPTGKAI